MAQLGCDVSEAVKGAEPLSHAPRDRPVVFIGSSSEGERVAECIFRYLSRLQVVPKLWSKGMFEASKTTIEELVRAAGESDFAVIVLTPDDITASRRKRKVSPRDNVIFELGLFMGAISKERTYVLSPANTEMKIPTDLLGITMIHYRHRGSGTLAHRA